MIAGIQTPIWWDLLPGMPVFLVLLGLAVGSFANVVIDRLPAGRSLIRPGSRCDACGAPIPPWWNVPLLGYLLLRGRCRACGAAIGIRVPIVEALGAAAVLLGSITAPDPAAAAVRSAFLVAMLIVAAIDLDHQIIPNEITLPGVVVGLLVCPLLGVSRLDALLGAAGGAFLFYGLARTYFAIRRVEGMGMGDVKLIAAIGAFLGWQGAALTILLGSFAGAAAGAILIFAGRADRLTRIPFGTFLAPAAAAALLIGPSLWAWYLGLFPPPR